MGLDSVELVMEIEKYFGVEIPNPDAEKISTLQDCVNTIARLLNVSQEDSALKDIVFNKLNEVLINLRFAPSGVIYSDSLTLTIPAGESGWKKLAAAMELLVPFPSGKYYKHITIDLLVDAICAANFGKLIDNENIKGSYEIYIAIMAITVECTGIDIYEVRPHKTFANDFGID